MLEEAAALAQAVQVAVPWVAVPPLAAQLSPLREAAPKESPQVAPQATAWEAAVRSSAWPARTAWREQNLGELKKRIFHLKAYFRVP